VTPSSKIDDASPSSPRWSASFGTALFAVGLAALLAYAAWLGRDLWFFSDDWDIIAFHHGGAYLTPYNGHLWLVPIFIFHTLYVTAGLGSFTPYRVVGLVSYAALGVTFYAYLRRRVTPVVAALAALSVVWFSTAQYDVLFPLLMNFSVPLACTAGIWMLLDGDTPRRDLAAGGLLALALATNSVGLITAAVVASELLVRRAPLRRWLPFIPPFALWLLWYAVYHTPMAGPGGVGAVSRYALHEVQATFAAFGGGSNALGYVLFAATAVLFGIAIFKWHTFNARAAGALVGFASFALLTAYTRQGFVPPVAANTPRYLWLNAFFLLAAVAEVIRSRSESWLPLVVGTIIVVLGAVTLVGNLRDYHQQVVTDARTTRTYLTAVEAIPDRINPRRHLPVSYITVDVGDYLAAIRRLGSPIPRLTLRGLGSQSDRATADDWMITDLGLGFGPGGAPSGATCSSVPATVARAGFTAHAPSAIVVRTGSTPARWMIARLARLAAPTRVIAPDSEETLRIPADHLAVGWKLRVTGDGATVALCR
jgi:hypothetical protein